MKNVEFFGKQVSKLIIGDNPMSGHSYIEDITPGDEMVAYYTAENIKKALHRLEELGYNTMLPLADPYMIRILKEYEVPATFFVVGAWVDKYPESVKALSDAGHQIQNHSNTHPHMPQLSKEQMIDEIESCNKKIENITGKCPTLLRPPYGDYDNVLIETINELDMSTIQWDVDSLDWKDNATPDSICKRVTSKVQNGSIVLFHNDADHTPAALPNILKCLKDEGYEFVFISDLIYKENYEIKHDGTQCKKDWE